MRLSFDSPWITVAACSSGGFWSVVVYRRERTAVGECSVALNWRVGIWSVAAVAAIVLSTTGATQTANTVSAYVVYFASGSAQINPAGAAELDRFAQAYQRLGLAAVVIEGFSDVMEPGGNAQPSGRPTLSQERANNARAYLAGKGIPDRVMSTDDLGSASPPRGRGGPLRVRNRQVVVVTVGASN